MDPLLVIVLAAVVAVVAWVVVKRRRPAPTEDEWVLPPDDSGPSILARPTSTERPWASEGMGSGPVLDRDFLLNRDRTFDPSRWDNTPDAHPDDRGIVGASESESPDAAAGDLPRYFDRDYLERLRERRDAGQGDAVDGDGDPR